jgi:hypothetical protein
MSNIKITPNASVTVHYTKVVGTAYSFDREIITFTAPSQHLCYSDV